MKAVFSVSRPDLAFEMINFIFDEGLVEAFQIARAESHCSIAEFVSDMAPEFRCYLESKGYEFS